MHGPPYFKKIQKLPALSSSYIFQKLTPIQKFPTWTARIIPNPYSHCALQQNPSVIHHSKINLFIIISLSI